jgi:hypothetical protein
VQSISQCQPSTVTHFESFLKRHCLPWLEGPQNPNRWSPWSRAASNPSSTWMRSPQEANWLDPKLLIMLPILRPWGHDMYVNSRVHYVYVYVYGMWYMYMMCIYIYVCVCTYVVYLRIFTYMYVYVRICTYMYVYVRICTYMYVPTCLRT